MSSLSSLAFILLSSALLASQEPTRLVAASNVRLRAAPAASADVIGTVPLGAALVELETGGEGGTWVRVRLPQGIDGWTPSRLTRRYTGETRWTVIDALARERLARRGDSFPARAQLVDFLERARGEVRDPEVSGRLAVHWLEAMAYAFEAIPMTQARAQPYAAWLESRRDAVVYNEPGGQWMLRRETILDLHARERDTSAADDIAWFLTEHGLPGECEGFVPCHVRRANELDGEYLRRHPAGRHLAEAVTRLAEAAARWAGGDPYFHDPSRDCAELASALAPLRDAVAQTRVDARGPALAALDKLKAACAQY
jgi:hypothetical protein